MALMMGVNHIAQKYKMPLIFSTHPRTQKFIEARNFTFHPLVVNRKPFGYLDYNKLQMNAFCVLSDSGTLSEESALLNFPGVLIRTSTERPEVLDKGSVVVGGIKERDIEQAVELAVTMFQREEKIPLPKDYEDVNVSAKVVKIIQSYTKIVNQTIWMK